MKKEKERKKVWWRWKECMSAGKSSYWTYTYSYASTLHELEDYLDHAGLLNTWSEHYRSILGKKVSKIPLEEICKQIEDASSALEAANEKLIELRDMKITWYGLGKFKKSRRLKGVRV